MTRTFPIARWMLALSSVAACGGAEDATVRVGFRVHHLECARDGLQARLEISGVDGVCPLSVGANRTVSGICTGVPAGDVRNFRLVYYAYYDSTDVDLATAVLGVDLRGQKERSIRLEFPQDHLETDKDDDLDGRTNIREFCLGTHPLVQD